jgi:2-amino-4-hydroxy-6-hydroxymethyldihydropteridine diphosphokinase
MNNGIFILLGSNEGDGRQNLKEAERRIAAQAGEVVARSSVYKTAAWGLTSQADFYNCVLEIRSPYPPEDLLEKVLAIEKDMGRVRKEKWGPRLIDIDILFYGKEIRNNADLVIPHPGIPERRFVLVPLAEIAPAFVHPGLNKTVAGMLGECGDRLAVERV